MSSKEILGGIYLFNKLAETELEKVVGLCKEAKFSVDEIIFNEDDTGDKFYMIVDGKVMIRKMIPGVGEGTLTILSRGDFFGEMALINVYINLAQIANYKRWCHCDE